MEPSRLSSTIWGGLRVVELRAILGPPASEKRSPPISKTNPRMKQGSSIRNKSKPIFPAMTYQGENSLRPNRNPDSFLALHLKTPRLNDVHQHLWLAGLPNAARPLHRQKLIGRSIFITEDPDEHLVWSEAQIFIKPLPDFLLDYDYWDENLCSEQRLRGSACGLLLSYAWLVRYKSDLDIAKAAGLVSEDIEWPAWVAFLEVFLDNIDLESLSDVNERYRYGELRLSRLNSIYRLIPPERSVRSFIRGYRGGSTWYNEFFGRHFKWMLVVFGIFSVFLSALQVGLATRKLQGNRHFQDVSYVFAIISLVALGACVLLVFSVWLALFWYHLLSTWRNDRRVDRRRRTGLSSP